LAGGFSGISHHNLVGRVDGSAGIANGLNWNQVGTMASPVYGLVSVLGAYGGPTGTIGLLPGSRAIDAGDGAVCGAAVGAPDYGAGGVDARGIARTGFGASCDIGAFESRGFTLGALTGTPQHVAVNTPFAAPLGLTVSAVAAGEPVANGVVTFTAPASGASTNPAVSTAEVDGSGHVSRTVIANAIGGAYEVVARAAGVATPVSFSLTNDAAGLPTFADAPLQAGFTRIRAVHVTELRQAIDALRQRYGLSAFAWTDAAIVVGVTPIKAAHVMELRTALAQAYAAAGRSAPTFAGPSNLVGALVMAAQIAELREAVLAIW
jgi:hypothetical protein